MYFTNAAKCKPSGEGGKVWPPQNFLHNKEIFRHNKYKGERYYTHTRSIIDENLESVC
jgi:hypothetical protein